MTDAEFLTTGYTGLQTGILAVTAIFTLVFAYLGGLRLFLREERFSVRLAAYLMFVITFIFLNLLLYSASLFGEEWIDLRQPSNPDKSFYANNSVLIFRWLWTFITFATLVFISLETFRKPSEPKSDDDSDPPVP